MKIIGIILTILAFIFLGGFYCWQNQKISEETQVREVVLDFGKKLQFVPLTAETDIVAVAIKENYADFVSPELLLEWEKNPSQAPGRLTSSPWPERIEINSIIRASGGSYIVKGDVIEITSVEVVSGGISNKYPVIIGVKKISGEWLISSFEKENIYCTLDVKLCPDGSYVGRIPPNCEFSPCPNAKTGTLKGKVSIGPLCPVEPCPGTVPNPYISRTIILQKQNGQFFPPIFLQEDGSFETEIAVGTYILNLSDCSFLGCNYSLPKTVVIMEGKTTEINIEIDTGIR